MHQSVKFVTTNLAHDGDKVHLILNKLLCRACIVNLESCIGYYIGRYTWLQTWYCKVSKHLTYNYAINIIALVM